MLCLRTSDNYALLMPRATATRSTFIANAIDDTTSSEAMPTIPLPLVDSTTLQLTFLLADKHPYDRVLYLQQCSLFQLLHVAEALNFLDMPEMLESVLTALTSRLRTISDPSFDPLVKEACLLSLCDGQAGQDVIVWPANSSDDIFEMLLPRLGIHDSRALLQALTAVSAPASSAWAAGAAAREAVAHRAWAATVTLHELAGRDGARWFGDDAIEVVRARLHAFPKEATNELRTFDQACGWLPLHHAAFQARHANNDAILLELVKAYPDARALKSRAVNAGQTPRDIARHSGVSHMILANLLG